MNPIQRQNPYLIHPSATPVETVQQAVVSFKGEGEYFSADLDSYKLSFNVNQPPNPVTNNNNLLGGVYADIAVSPATGNAGPTTSIDHDKVYFELVGPSGGLYQKSIDNVHLKNGNYTMRIRNAQKLNHTDILGLIRSTSFTITYRVMDSAVTNHNYNCGGVRIKAITETDPYSQVSSVKNYIYHNPVNDSSYGTIIGPSVNAYYDYTHHQTANPIGTVNIFSYYLARMGNCVIPGNNPTMTPVFYPKVIEQSRLGNEVFRTEHYFNAHKPIYTRAFPFTPPIDKESLRGKPTRSIAYRQNFTGHPYAGAVFSL